MKASDCCSCRFCISLVGTLPATCMKGHKPRFYTPRSPIDQDYGWKRVCDDYRK